MSKPAILSQIPVEKSGEQNVSSVLQTGEKWFLGSLMLLSVALRLIRITEPFLDSWSWKQLTNAMVSRNFYLHGYHFFFPQVDWAGPYPGYIGTEFPLVPFLASLLYAVFGVHEWIGRSISIFFFIIAVPAFYLLVRKISNTQSACIASVAYCVAPLAFMASRSFQSDIASLNFAIIAIYFFSEWLDELSSRKLFFLAAAASTLAILVKLPQLLTGVPLLYLAWEKYGTRLLRKGQLWTFAVLTLIPPLAWELHAYHVSVTQYPYHFAGEGGVRIMSGSFYWQLLKVTFTESLTPILAVGLIAGLFVWPRAKYGKVFHFWLLGFVVFVILTGRENRHPWVQLPAVPIAAAFLGVALDSLGRRLFRSLRQTPALATTCAILFATILFVSMSILSFGSLRAYYKPWQLPSYHAAVEIQRITTPSDLIVTADNGDPVVIYYSGRRGWHFMEHFGGRPSNSAEATEELERLRAQGGRYFVLNAYTIWWLDYYKLRDFRMYLDSRYRRVSESPEYVIYDISGAGRSASN